MDEVNLYYKAPSDESFDDMKQAARAIWNTYKDPYKTEKLERIKNVGNISDNFMYLLAMFDNINQRKVAKLLKEDTVEDLRERLLAGNNGDQEYTDNILGL